MPRISITRAALREVRQRLAAFPIANCVRITGPSEAIGPSEASWWLETDLEDVRLLEKLYGKPPRWRLELSPRGAGKAPTRDVYREEIEGIGFEIFTSKPVPSLHVELYREALRVHEVDA